MANIIPILTDTQISEIEPKSEQKVYKALSEQLPDNWLVIHSLKFIKKRGVFFQVNLISGNGKEIKKKFDKSWRKIDD